jgi:hypothetical protein
MRIDACTWSWGLDPDGTPRVTAWEVEGRLHLQEAEGTWNRHSKPDSAHAPTRLDHLQVELGTPSIGSTLQVLFCVQNTGRTPDFQWVTAPHDIERAQLRIHLDQGGSFYRVAMDPWDDALQDLEDGEGGLAAALCAGAAPGGRGGRGRAGHPGPIWVRIRPPCRPRAAATPESARPPQVTRSTSSTEVSPAATLLKPAERRPCRWRWFM